MKRTTAIICGMLAAVWLLAGTASADTVLRRPGHSIIGAWDVEITVRFDSPDCTTAPMVPFGVNPFPGLQTFHVGGTVSETGSRSPPSTRSPGHGVWRRVGPDDFVARYTFQLFDPNGFLLNIMDISNDIRLAHDGDSFSGVSRLRMTDVSGNTLKFCATMEAERITI